MDKYTLRNAGLKEDEIIKIMETPTIVEKQKMLKKIRCRLVNDIHKEQQKLDSLDYILYQLQNGGNDNDF